MSGTNRPIGIGEKLELFLLSLMDFMPNSSLASITDGGSNYLYLLDKLMDVEDHEASTDLNESAEVVQEITKDARRKAAQVIRTPLVEVTNGIIASVRKRLRTKISLDNESSLQHSQRHVNIMVDLFGPWSDPLDTITSQSLSYESLQLIFSSLQSRIVEVAGEVFQAFKQDKEIESILQKLVDPNAPVYPLQSLDMVVNQFLALREIIQQYYLFVLHLLQSRAIYSIDTCTIYNKEGDVCFIPSKEFLLWREMDILFLSLEFHYITYALMEASKTTTLIELQPSVYIPQFIEDALFLLVKSLQRVIATKNPTSIFAMGNKLLEFLQFNTMFEESCIQGCSKSMSCMRDSSFIYAICKNKRLYKGCVKRFRVRDASMRFLVRACLDPLHGQRERGAKDSTNRSSKPKTNSSSSSSNNNSSDSSVPPLHAKSSGGSASSYSTPSKLPRKPSNGQLAPPMPASLSADDVNCMSGAATVTATEVALNELNYATEGIASVLSDVTGMNINLTQVNGWLMNIASPYIPRDNEPTRSHPAAGPPISNRNEAMGTPVQPPRSKTPPPTAVHNRSENKLAASGSLTAINDLLAEALTLNIDDDSSDEEYSSSTGPGPYEESINLIGADWMVYLNTLTVVIRCIDQLHQCIQEASQDPAIVMLSSIGSQSSISSLEITLQELMQCKKQYEALHLQEIRTLTQKIFDAKVKNKLHTFFHDRLPPHELTGAAMDEHWHDHMLASVFDHWLYITEPMSSTTDSNSSKAPSVSGYTGYTGGNPPPEQSNQQLQQQKKNKSKKDKEKASITANEKKLKVLQGEEMICFQKKQLVSAILPASAMMSASNLPGKHPAAGASSQGLPEDGDASHLVPLAEEGRLSALGRESMTCLHCCFGQVLGEYLLSHCVLKRSFNEWGAMLLHEEVLTMTRVIEDSPNLEEIYRIKQALSPLHLIIKLLTLDSPADLRRYTLPQPLPSPASPSLQSSSSCIQPFALDEKTVRSILQQRVDFSKEAIQKVKIAFTQPAS